MPDHGTVVKKIDSVPAMMEFTLSEGESWKIKERKEKKDQV
jgi:hypothetical protein